MARFNFPSRLPRSTSVDSFPANLVAGNRNFYTEISFRTYSPRTGGFLSSLTGAISGVLDNTVSSYVTIPTGNVLRLPIPRKLNENYVLGWSEKSYTDILTSFSSNANPLATTLSAVSGIAGAAASATSFLSPITGYNVNPFLFVYFQRPNFKQYSFTWTLAARNQQESEKIRSIVNRIKERSSPTIDGLVMKFPDVVDISFAPDEVFGMLKMKPCVITSVMVDYTPAGPSFFNSKAPTLVSLTLNLKEIELWSQQDYTGAPSGSFFDAGEPYEGTGAEGAEGL